MEAREPDHNSSQLPHGAHHSSHPAASSHHGQGEAAPAPHNPPPHHTPAMPLVSLPPEAFGRGILERAPEAFGCPDSQESGGDDDDDEDSDEDSDEDEGGSGDQDDDHDDDDEEDSDKEEKKDNGKKAGDKKSKDKGNDKDKKNKSGDKKKGDKKKGNDKDEKKKKRFYQRPVLMIVLVLVLLLLIVGALIYWLYSRQYVSTDDAYVNGHIISISPNVGATVAVVYIDDNYSVKRGELLVQLDPRDYQAVVDQTTANLTAAKDKAIQANVELDAARAQVSQAQAQVTIAQTNAENASLNYNRYAALSPEARSQEQLDDALAAHRSADAQVLQAKAQVTSAEANAASADSAITLAGAQIKIAQANLESAQINLGYCKIVAPEDGLITEKNVEPGSYVEKGQPLFSIVPTNTWVIANVKETQLLRVRINQPVTVEVDALGGKKFQGHVNSVQNGTGARFSLLPAENATGNWVKIVQRVPVKIILDNTNPNDRQTLLSPGLSVEVKIKVR